MKLVYLALVILCLLLSVSCGQVPEYASWKIDRATQVWSVANITDRNDGTFSTYPDTVSVSNLRNGDTVDTWQQNDVKKLYQTGEPCGIIIINHSGADKQYHIWLTIDSRESCNTNGTTGYKKAPDYVLDWITVSNNSPVIKAYSAILVPISIVIPENANLGGVPDDWSFNVYASERLGSVQYAQGTRWLIHMG